MKALNKLFKPDCGHIVKKYEFYGVAKQDKSGTINLCWDCIGKTQTIEIDSLLSDLMFKNIEDEKFYSKAD